MIIKGKGSRFLPRLGGTQGRANFTMQFDHYEQVPANIAAEIVEKFK